MAGSGKKNNFLVGFLLGLLTGLALSVAVALLVTRNSPFIQKKGILDIGGSSSSSAPTTPIEAPKYEFYQAPAEPINTAPNVAPPPAPAEPVGPIYFLQAGAYGNAAEAEQAKARLALLGFEAKVLSALENEKMLHKVRIGPYKKMNELDAARARLTQNGMETILVKIQPQEKP